MRAVPEIGEVVGKTCLEDGSTFTYIFVLSVASNVSVGWGVFGIKVVLGWRGRTVKCAAPRIIHVAALFAFSLEKGLPIIFKK